MVKAIIGYFLGAYVHTLSGSTYIVEKCRKIDKNVIYKHYELCELNIIFVNSKGLTGVNEIPLLTKLLIYQKHEIGDRIPFLR